MLAEVTFIHQRGTIYGIYWATQNIVTSLLTLASSYEVAALGWRWFYWVFVITVAVGLVLVVFACFETRFQRRPIFLGDHAVVTDQYGVTRVLTVPETQEYLASDEGRFYADLGGDTPPKKTYRQMLNAWPRPCPHPVRNVLLTWWQMLETFSSPGIIYATLLSAVILGGSVGVSLTYDTVLQYNYDWSAANIGLINLGGVFGGLGGMLYAGILGDRVIVWLARRAGGVHKPEHHLLLLIFPGLLAVASLILYGFTASGNATWGGPFMGWTLYQVAFVSTLIRTTSFATEAWEKNPGPALVTVVGTKNIIGFGVSYGLNPMVAKYSYPAAMGILAGVVGGILLLGIPVYFFNPMVSTCFFLLLFRKCSLAHLDSVETVYQPATDSGPGAAWRAVVMGMNGFVHKFRIEGCVSFASYVLLTRIRRICNARAIIFLNVPSQTYHLASDYNSWPGKPNATNTDLLQWRLTWPAC